MFGDAVKVCVHSLKFVSFKCKSNNASTIVGIVVQLYLQTGCMCNRVYCVCSRP